jgi:hypothetical protein
MIQRDFIEKKFFEAPFGTGVLLGLQCIFPSQHTSTPKNSLHTDRQTELERDEPGWLLAPVFLANPVR